MSRKTLSVAAASCLCLVVGPWAQADRTPVIESQSVSRPLVALVQAGKMKDQYLIDVYASGASDLRSYQIAIQTSGGSSGKLVLAGAVINRQREDYVFGGANVITAESVPSARLGAVAYESGVEVPDWAYLGTYVLRPTADAAGEFRVSVKVAGNETLLADTSNEPIDFVTGPEVVIRLERRPTLRTATTTTKTSSK